VSRDLSQSASSRDDDLPSPGALTSQTTSSKKRTGRGWPVDGDVCCKAQA
jgi:hypothetical protein